MFKVQVKTSQEWQLRRKFLKPNVWTSVSGTDHGNMKNAEVEVAYLTQEFEDCGELLQDFKINYRILNNNEEVIWSKDEVFNEKVV